MNANGTNRKDRKTCERNERQRYRAKESESYIIQTSELGFPTSKSKFMGGIFSDLTSVRHQGNWERTRERRGIRRKMEMKRRKEERRDGEKGKQAGNMIRKRGECEREVESGDKEKREGKREGEIGREV